MAGKWSTSFSTRVIAVSAVTALTAAVSLTVAAPAHAAAGDISVTVVSGGNPVGGALVSVDLAGQTSQAKIADNSGVADFTGLAAGTWVVAASKAGYATGSASADATTGDSKTVSLAASPANFSNVPVFGAQGASVVAGAPGEFYATTSVIPQVFRTLDYGGTWTPATVGYDDAANGLDATSPAGSLTASGVAGEVAVTVGNFVYFSKDFGSTWTKMTHGTPVNNMSGASAHIWWAHRGTTSTLLARNGDSDTYVADMEASTPAWSAKAYSSSATSSDLISVGNGSDEPWVAVARGSSTKLYPLNADPIVAPIDVPANGTIDCVAIGGAPLTPGSTQTPTILYYSTSGGSAESAIRFNTGAGYAGATTKTETGAGAAACDATGPSQTGVNGSAMVATSDSTHARLHIGAFFASYTIADGLTTGAISPGESRVGGAYSSAYSFTASTNSPNSADNVYIFPQGDRGFAKSTAFKTPGAAPGNDSDVYLPYEVGVSAASPQFNYNVYQNAGPGTSRDSAGGSVSGMSVAVTTDIAFNAADSNKESVMLSTSGGGQGLASADGGATLKSAVNKGGQSTAWWGGTGGHDWLVFGHNNPFSYTLIKDWADTDNPKTNGDQDHQINAGVDSAMAGSSPSGTVGIAHNDSMLATTRKNGTQGSGGVFRAALSGSKGAEDVSVSASHAFSNDVNGLAYCPAASSNASMADRAYLAMGDSNDDGAGLRQVTSASSTSDLSGSAMSGLPSGLGQIIAVDANCDAGVIAVAGKNAVSVSQDAGATWLSVSLTGGGDFKAIAVEKDTSDPAATKVEAARGAEGFTYQSNNGGLDWVTVNDPANPATGGRSFTTEGIKTLEFPGDAAAARSVAHRARTASQHVSSARVSPAAAAGSAQAGTGSGTAALSASATGPSAGHGTQAGGGGGSTTPSKSNQSLELKIPAKLKRVKGKKPTYNLPRTTNQGGAVTWSIVGVRFCKVSSYKLSCTKSSKKKSLILRAKASPTSTLNAFSQDYSRKVA